MNFEEFLRPKEEPVETDVTATETDETAAEVAQVEEIDVQKAVVESLANDKAELNEEISHLKTENKILVNRNAAYAAEKKELEARFAALQEKVNAMKTALDNVGNVLTTNTEKPLSNQVTLLERDMEVADRFEGETREHVLEILKEVQQKDEAEGRCRRAQLLEAVLKVNENPGNLAKRRETVEKIFTDNLNVVSGKVIEELKKFNITYKLGDKYLTAEEIIKRSF